MKNFLSNQKYLVRIGGILVLLVITVLLYTGFISKPQSFATETVSVGNVAEVITVTGKVRGESEKTYYAKVSAPISQMEIEIGDEIEKSASVVTYETTDLERMKVEAELRVDASENGFKAKVEQSNQNASRYAKASADEQAYQYLYALSRTDADALSQGQYQETWNIQCETDSINKKIADKNKQLAEKNGQLNALTDKTTEEAKNLSDDIAALSGDVAGLQGSLASLPAGDMTPDENAHSTYDSNLMEDITRNWTQATTEANTYESQIMNKYAKEELESSHQLNELSVQTTIENLETASRGVTAEFGGVIKEVNAKAGAVVAKGAPLFTVESTDAMKVNTEVSKYDIGKVRMGQKALITIAGKTYDGAVSEIKRLAIEDSSDKAKITVSVSILEPDDSIILGIEADVDIYADEKENALLIPATALYTDENGNYCYCIQDGKVNKKNIVTGIASTSKVEVLEGLANGEHVITDAITDEQVGQKAVEEQ